MTRDGARSRSSCAPPRGFRLSASTQKQATTRPVFSRLLLALSNDVTTLWTQGAFKTEIEAVGAQEDGEETRAAQGGISDGARSGYAGGAVRCGLDCGLRFLGQHPVIYWKQLVGLGGLEPPTSPLSGARSSHLSYRPVKQRQILARGRAVRTYLAISKHVREITSPCSPLDPSPRSAERTRSETGTRRCHSEASP